ncbi:hypothetical protein BDQ17DRAFT_1422680 [Cyathus striatus]|nr:hypothetical protein BDQ17DRAFT_1422680 [Cyathus striatus]
MFTSTFTFTRLFSPLSLLPFTALTNPVYSGNPLGTIYKPCNSASSSLSPSTCFIHKLPPGPTGPLYYSPPRSRPSLGRSSSNSSSDSSGSSASGSGSGSGSSSTVVEEDERGRKESYSYTFFPSCVSSLPSYIFPERTRRRSALNSASEGNNYVYSTPGYPYSTGTGARDVSGYRSHGVGRDQGGDRGVEEGGEEEGDGEGEWTFVSPFVPPVDGAYVPPEVYARFGAPGPGSQPASAAPVQSQGEGGLGTRQGGGGTPTSIPPATPAPAPAPVRDEALRIRGSDGEMYFPSMTTSAERAETGETVGGLGLEVTDGSGDVQDELRELEQEAGSEEREPRTGVPREEQAGEQREGQAQGEGPREGEGDASRTYLTIPRPRLGVNARYPYVLQPFYSGSFATPSVVPAPPSAPSVPSSAPPASGPPGPTASSPTAPDWWEALAQRHGTGDEDVWGRVDADSWGSDWAGIPQSMQTMTPRRERERERAPRREERIRMMFDAGMRRDRARALRRQSQSQTLLQAQALIRAEVQSLSQDVGQAAEGNEVTLPIRAFSSPTSASYPVYPTPHPSTFQYRYSYPSSSSDSSDEEAVESMVRRRRRRTQSPEYPASWREDADDVADVADYLLGLDYVPGLPGLETQVQTQTQTQPQTQVQAQGQPIQVPREMLQGTPFGDLLDMQRDSAAQARIPSGLLEGSPFTYGIDARPNQNQAQVQSSRRALLRRRPTRQRGIYISISSPSSSSSEDSESSEDEAVAALPSYPTGPVSRVRGIDRLAGTGTQTERSGITILVPSGHSSSAASPSSPLISPGPFIPSPRWHSAPLSPTLPVRPASPSPPNTPPPFNSAPSTSATMAASASQPSSPSFSDLLRSATSSGMEARLPLPLPSYFRSTASTASEGEWGQGMGMWSWGVPEAGVLDPDGEIEVDPDGDGVVLEEEEDERKVPSGIWFDR